MCWYAAKENLALTVPYTPNFQKAGFCLSHSLVWTVLKYISVHYSSSWEHAVSKHCLNSRINLLPVLWKNWFNLSSLAHNMSMVSEGIFLNCFLFLWRLDYKTILLLQIQKFYLVCRIEWLFMNSILLR